MVISDTDPPSARIVADYVIPCTSENALSAISMDGGYNEEALFFQVIGAILSSHKIEALAGI